MTALLALHICTPIGGRCRVLGNILSSQPRVKIHTMAHFASFSHHEGQSTSCPPYFDCINYNYWKARTHIYLMQDSSLMQAIKKGVTLADMEKMDKWTAEERMSMETNAKAMNTLICALCLRNSTEYQHAILLKKFGIN